MWERVICYKIKGSAIYWKHTGTETFSDSEEMKNKLIKTSIVLKQDNRKATHEILYTIDIVLKGSKIISLPNVPSAPEQTPSDFSTRLTWPIWK